VRVTAYHHRSRCRSSRGGHCEVRIGTPWCHTQRGWAFPSGWLTSLQSSEEVSEERQSRGEAGTSLGILNNHRRHS
jgi:hypothetical protein